MSIRLPAERRNPEATSSYRPPFGDRFRNNATYTRNETVETRIENCQRASVWARLNSLSLPCMAKITTKIKSRASGPKAAPMSTQSGHRARERSRAGNARANGSPTNAHPRIENTAYNGNISNQIDSWR